jgi:hypothetical protein
VKAAKRRGKPARPRRPRADRPAGPEIPRAELVARLAADRAARDTEPAAPPRGRRRGPPPKREGLADDHDPVATLFHGDQLDTLSDVAIAGDLSTGGLGDA